MENQEPLQTSTVVCQLADSVKAKIHNFFANGVMTSSKVVCGIFFATDELFWVEELAVCASADLIDHSWLEI
jgi:beta-N-acetylglucosaminidase